MYHLSLYLCSRKVSAKLIIYDGNTAIDHVNNCYRHAIFMRKTGFQTQWKFQFTAYSR